MSLVKFSLVIFFFAIFSQQSIAQIKSIDTKALVKMMEGSFSSEEQSKTDSDYYDIRLHIKRIWPELSSEYWLYAEQAFAESQDKPYRQSVYRITNTYEGRFKISEYALNDQFRFAGEWRKENPLSELTPDSLTLLEGCFVVVTLMNDNTYEGSNDGNGCESDLPGAKYETSELKIGKDKIISWSRGYDENDKQVLGAERGGYIFLRVYE